MVCSRASFTFTFTVNNLVREIVVMVRKSREISAVFITSPDAVSRQGDDLSLVQTDEYKETLTAVFCKTLTAVFYIRWQRYSVKLWQRYSIKRWQRYSVKRWQRYSIKRWQRYSVKRWQRYSVKRWRTWVTITSRSKTFSVCWVSEISKHLYDSENTQQGEWLRTYCRANGRQIREHTARYL